jgi:hypothetical protein
MYCIINLQEKVWRRAKGGLSVITYQWVDFTIFDLSSDEELHYTQRKFEEMVDDKFEAMELDEEGFPKYIWTTKYVFSILTKNRLMGQLAIVGVPRNPQIKT